MNVKAWWSRLIYRVVHFFSGFISNTTWASWQKHFTGSAYGLTEENRDDIRKRLAKNYHIILTFERAHLSNWFIKILSWTKTGKWPIYCHALMNVDNEMNPDHPENFKLMQATHAGVGWATFDQVFNCDAVCLLTPASMSPAQWTAIVDVLVKQDGKPYDDLFDLLDSKKLSCVELVRICLAGDGNYTIDFANLEKLITTYGNLTPQMFRDCPDFNVQYEVIT